MENQKSSKELVQRSTSVQTEQITCVPSEEIMFCNVCEYPAEDLYNLGEHMFEFHAEKSEKKLDCHYCDDSFDTKNLLMKHRKASHLEKVKPCIFFSEGMCTYGELCWFNHDTRTKVVLIVEFATRSLK